MMRAASSVSRNTRKNMVTEKTFAMAGLLARRGRARGGNRPGEGHALGEIGLWTKI